MPSTSLPIETGMLTVGEPLPFNIHTNDGTLLLREGMILYSQQQIYTLIERGSYTIPPSEEPETQRIDSLVHKIDDTFTRYMTHGINISRKLITLADDLEFYTRHNPDALIGIIHLRTDVKYSVIRAIQNTVLSVLMASKLGWEAKRITSMARAALSENIGLYPLQDELCKQNHELEEWQTTLIREHPKKAVKVLIGMGVRDRDWLSTVGYHHERMDGSGYMNGISGDAIPEEARILAIVDRYGAMITQRGERQASTPQEVLLAFIQPTDDTFNKYDQELSRLLIKEIGLYPPGTTVVLNNDETAIVSKRSEDPVSPEVISICDAYGDTMECPKHRDSRIRTYKIRKAVELDWSRHLNVDLIWDSGTEDICYASLFRFEDPNYV